MKTIAEMTQIEVAAYVQSRLEERGIQVVLSGGAAVSFFCDNRYTSADIDLVNKYMVKRAGIQAVMDDIGFSEIGRYFKHPRSPFIIEFPPGPLTVGVEPVKEIRDVVLDTGTLRVISPTDCVKDRLAAYYHWGDEQCLYQAALIRDAVEIDVNEIERWSRNEGNEVEYRTFLTKKVG